MYAGLSPGAIGVKFGTIEEAVAGADRHGFGGVEINPDEVITRGVHVVKSIFADAGIEPAGWGLPVEWRRDEETWKQGLEKLPAQAKAAGAIGCRRCSTWVLPGSNDRELDENLEFHRQRFGPIAQILADSGVSLGLEFIGPKTLRDQFKFPFPYTSTAMLELALGIGPNVGLLVDAWHWYTAEETVDDLLALRPNDVVYVHVNDAPAGVAVTDQVDNVRKLPGETGVIDIAAFLGALKKIGYTGPVTAEPFDKGLADLADDEARLAAVAAATKKILATIA